MEYSKEKIDAAAYTSIGTEAEYDAPHGRIAVKQAEAKQTISADGKIVPFHALDMLGYQRSVEKAEKPNPYGCEAPNDPSESSSKVCEGKACAMKVAC